MLKSGTRTTYNSIYAEILNTGGIVSDKNGIVI